MGILKLFFVITVFSNTLCVFFVSSLGPIRELEQTFWHINEMEGLSKREINEIKSQFYDLILRVEYAVQQKLLEPDYETETEYKFGLKQMLYKILEKEYDEQGDEVSLPSISNWRKARENVEEEESPIDREAEKFIDARDRSQRKIWNGGQSDNSNGYHSYDNSYSNKFVTDGEENDFLNRNNPRNEEKRSGWHWF